MNESICSIGTLIKGDDDHRPSETIRKLAWEGFESFSLMFWETLGNADPLKLIEHSAEAAAETGTRISAVSVYGNPLRGDERGEETLRSFRALIEASPAAGSSDLVVSGFAGRVPGASVPDSIEAWRVLFEPLAERAAALGIRIAFENCRLGDTWKTGRWNIAINPDAWDLMFSTLPYPVIGLEWEPCHQIEALADPLQQLREWLPRIFHIHGKDARIDGDLLARSGLYGSRKWQVSCFPGFGDTDWQSLIALLGQGGYRGAVDIEGWNDPDWSGEKELEGQVRALRYLKLSRSGAFRS